MHSRSARTLHHCLQKRLALLCGFVCDQKMSPKKLVSADIFASFGPTKKNIPSSATPHPPPPG